KKVRRPVEHLQKYADADGRLENPLPLADLAGASAAVEQSRCPRATGRSHSAERRLAGGRAWRAAWGGGAPVGTGSLPRSGAISGKRRWPAAAGLPRPPAISAYCGFSTSGGSG